MVTTIALTIIGSVLTLVGIIFNLSPKQINQKLSWFWSLRSPHRAREPILRFTSTPLMTRSLTGNLTEEASQVAAAFRIILGALGMTFGIVGISCRNFPVVEAQTWLIELGVGFCLIITLLITVKIRGFGEFPIPPTVMFAKLAAIAFYTTSGLTAEV